MDSYIWENFTAYLQSLYQYFESFIYSSKPENQNIDNLKKLTNLEVNEMFDGHENYKDEISNVKQNLKICNNWYENEIDRLKSDYKLKSFDSNSFHNQKDNLCKKLNCPESSRGMLIKQMQCKATIKELLDIQKKNVQLMETIDKQKEKIVYQDSVIDDQEVQLNSYIQKYKESNQYVISLLANNSTLTKRIKSLRFRIALIILGIIIVIFIGYIGFNWSSSSKLNRREKEDKGLKNIFSVKRGGAISEPSIYSKNDTFMTSVEYACILVHLEKIKNILNNYSEPVNNPKRKLLIPKLKFSLSIIAYIGISLLTMGEIKTSNRIQDSVLRNSISTTINPYLECDMNSEFSVSSEPTNSNQSYRKVKLGSSILSFENGKIQSSRIPIKKEKLIKINHTRVKYQFKTSSLNQKFKSRKRAKLVRLSDLPPMDSFNSNFDFYKNQINSHQNNLKIRNSRSN